ncbi:MAG: phosphoribosyl-ATP diphosphatase [Crenarchaeota archaeon]|nr:phosphoribosyl-ATP diphosphatase [Thermoproteota archaeon]
MSDIEFLLKLEKIIDDRIASRSESSYTWRLVSAGLGKICKKVIEESGEVAIAALSESNERLIEETADLIYHLLVLLRYKGLSIRDVVRLLEKRHQERTSK